MSSLIKFITIVLLLISFIVYLTGCGALLIGGAGAAGGYYYHKSKTEKKESKKTEKQEPVSTDTTGYKSPYSTGTNKTK